MTGETAVMHYDEETRAFYVLARTDELRAWAKETGLDRSVPASQREGCDVFLTHEPYAALPFYDCGSVKARDILFPLHLEYEASMALDCSYQPPAPPDMEFMPFQRAGILYALDRKHCLIGDQPGLGKTMEAIGLANAVGAERVLVVCPASVRRQWRREIALWSTIRRQQTYLIEKSSDGVSPFANYTVVSYDLARSQEVHNALMALEYDLLVLDEAHYLKTTDARRTRATFGGLRRFRNEADEGRETNEFGYRGSLAERSARVLGLTGTPLPNRPRECYNLFRHLAWDAIDWQSEDAFQHRYNPSFRWPSGRIEERRGRLPELRARLRCNLMVRRLKRDVLTQLPDKRYELAYVEPNGAIRKVLRAESLLDIDPDRLDEIDAKVWGQISTVRREMGVAKVPRVIEHIRMLLDGGLEKVFVAVHHREVAALMQTAFPGAAVIVGSTTPVQRERAKERFVEDPDCRVLLGQLQAAGTGIDGLQAACSHVVFAEASWTPGENEQFIDRLHRIGQDYSVLAQFLVAPGSLDERILGRAIEKLHTIHHTLDGD